MRTSLKGSSHCTDIIYNVLWIRKIFCNVSDAIIGKESPKSTIVESHSPPASSFSPHVFKLFQVTRIYYNGLPYMRETPEKFLYLRFLTPHFDVPRLGGAINNEWSCKRDACFSRVHKALRCGWSLSIKVISNPNKQTFYIL